MKKILICLLMAVVATNFAYSQTSSSAEDVGLKPVKGKWATELNFNPFQGDLKLNNALNQIKGRYFIQDDLALRLGFAVSSVDSSFSYGEPYGTEGTFNSNDRKRTGLDINVGIEKHFTGTRRLSPYIGLDLSWGTSSSEQDIATRDYSMNVKNGLMNVVLHQSGSYYYSTTHFVPDAYTRFGAFAVVGFDFYMAKHFLLGYEFNLGYLSTQYKSPEITVTGQGPNYGSPISNASTKSFSTSLINGVRIGYVF